MTTRSRPSQAPTSRYSLGLLRTTIITGSMLATIMGAQLLSRNEATSASTEPPMVAAVAASNIVVPIAEPLPWQTTLKPVPTVANTTQIALDEPTSNRSTSSSVPALTAIPTLQPLPDVVTLSTGSSTSAASAAASVDAAAVLSFEPREIKSVQIQAPITRSRSSR